MVKLLFLPMVGDMGQQFKLCTVARDAKIEQEELLYQSELRFKALVQEAQMLCVNIEGVYI
jgi:hypothetical protein